MSNIVEYILGLQSGQFEAGMAKATTATVGLESALSSVKGVLGTLGVGFAIFEGASFVKGSIEAVERLHQAEAQLRAGLISTRGEAGITFDELENSALRSSQKIRNSRIEIMEMQSLLLTFPSITKDVFGAASDAIFDMSTRLGQDLHSTAIQVGKALQDPDHGIVALRRVGVNFDKEQTEQIQTMVANGEKMKAQQFILNELMKEFGGSAKAAFDADPLAQFNKSVGSIKTSLGEIAMPAVQEIGDAMKSFADSIKDVIGWVKEHKEGLKDLALVVVGMAAPYVALKVANSALMVSMMLMRPVLLQMTYAVAAGGNAFEVAAVGATAFGRALNLALGPIGWVALAIGGLVEGYNLLADAEAKRERENRDSTANENNGLILSYVDRFGQAEKYSSMSHADFVRHEKSLIDSDNKEINKHFDEALRVGDKAGINKYSQASQDLMLKSKALDTFAKGKGGGAASPRPPKVDEAKAVGSKSVTINMHIGDLIRTFNVNTTNLQLAAAKVKDVVQGAIMSGLNDTQITAGVR